MSGMPERGAPCCTWRKALAKMPDGRTLPLTTPSTLSRGTRREAMKAQILPLRTAQGQDDGGGPGGLGLPDAFVASGDFVGYGCGGGQGWEES